MAHSKMTREQREQTRREFFRNAGCAALGMSGLMSQMWDMRRIAAAAQLPGTRIGAQPEIGAAGGAPGSGYKALVCLFLYGGNDSNNTIIPLNGGDYASYASARQGLALPQGQLHPITLANYAGPDLGLHPSMPDLAGLINAGKVAVLGNVGTLVEPMTLAQYQQGFRSKPLQLFSHSDQQFQWQTSISTGEARTGWGGRAAEIMDALNNNPKVAMSISLNGTNTFQVADDVETFQVDPKSGPPALWEYAENPGAGSWEERRSRAIQASIRRDTGNLLDGRYNEVFDNALANNAVAAEAIAKFPQTNAPFTAFDRDTDLGRQLQMIARLIAARNEPGMPDQRQVFFAGINGFDTHGSQLTPHNNLLRELNDGLKAFHDAMNALGVWDNVTLFTSSDFGRNYVMNGDDGSDHGWGSDHFVMGGSVDGGKLYGRFADRKVNGPDDVSLGRWLPTTSVDEYGVTMARWFGVERADLGQVFPNIGRFANGVDTDLGFFG